MTQFLPPNLLALFAARDPIPYLPPIDKLPHEKKASHNYVGLAGFVEGNFEDPKDTPPPIRVETREERLKRKKREKEEQITYKLEQEIALWDPHSRDDVTTDPFKTLFVARINYYTSESKIRREFESYGPIKQIKLVEDKQTGKPRGYCFIEFEHERDMHCSLSRTQKRCVKRQRQRRRKSLSMTFCAAVLSPYQRTFSLRLDAEKASMFSQYFQPLSSQI